VEMANTTAFLDEITLAQCDCLHPFPGGEKKEPNPFVSKTS